MRFLGSSIRACKNINRHVIAFEDDNVLYKEVLLPLIPQPDEVQSEQATLPPPKNKRPLEDDDEPEKKTAPKRSCK